MTKISKLVVGMLMLAMLGGMAVPAGAPVADDDVTTEATEGGQFLSEDVEKETLRPVLEEPLNYANSFGGVTQSCDGQCCEHHPGHCPDTCVNCYQPKGQEQPDQPVYV